MWFILLTLSTLLLLFYLTGIKPLRYWEERGVPFLKAWPYLGNMASYAFRKRAMAYVFDDIYKAFPERRYVGYFYFGQPALIIRDTELMKRIMVKEFESFPEHRDFIADDSDPLWNNNLFAMKGGQKWQKIRSILSPTFTTSKMKMMFELMKQCSKQFSNYHSDQNGLITLDLKDACSRFATDVIATTAFGITCDSLKNRRNEFYLMGQKLLDFIGVKNLTQTSHAIAPKLSSMMKVPLLSKSASSFFNNLIKKTIAIREEKNIFRPDLIHLLMEARKNDLKKSSKKVASITDEDIAAQALIFFFAGFDSVSTMMCFAAYELAVNPNIQKRLQDEIDSALRTTNGNITYEVLTSMKYLDMVISESLRKWPPFVILDRKCVTKFTIEPEKSNENALHIEPGTLCTFVAYSTQRDHRYFPNPEEFDPERFSEENKSKLNPFSYIVFGMGPRNCIGMRFAQLEGKLLLTEILRKFEIVPVDKTPVPIVLSAAQINTYPEGGFWLGLKPRWA